MRAPLPEQTTQLKDRVLWFDGDSAYPPNDLVRALQRFNVRYVTEITPDVDEFNFASAKEDALSVKTECRPLSTAWNTPEPYFSLDVEEYLLRAHDALFEDLSVSERQEREHRLVYELMMYKQRDLYHVLRAVIWIINTLTITDTVWGVGRGSSVSSYVLYVIGVHDVDSYAYGLEVTDFLHD